MNEENMDPKTKEELNRILTYTKKYEWNSLTTKEKNVEFHNYFDDTISNIHDKIVELVNNNNPEYIMGLKDIFTYFIGKAIPHSLVEIAYRRTHGKY